MCSFRVNILLNYLFSIFLIRVHAEENDLIFKTDTYNTRLYGGSDAPTGFAVYQASLRMGSDTTKHFCGGSFISGCHVLTAAHCQPVCADLSCKVGYGSNDLTQHILADVEEFLQHENYALEEDKDKGIISIENDIAIIKLKAESYPVFNGFVNYIHLVETNLPWFTRLVTTGWGYTDDQDTVPQNLQMTTLVVMPCSIFQLSWSKFLCTTTYKTGVCPGDSGGPLVYNNRLVGLTSFGSQCDGTFSRNAFSDVYYYKNWIETKIEELPC